MDDSTDTLILITEDETTSQTIESEWKYVPVRRTAIDQSEPEPLDLATDGAETTEEADTGHYTQMVWADTGF